MTQAVPRLYTSRLVTESRQEAMTAEQWVSRESEVSVSCQSVIYSGSHWLDDMFIIASPFLPEVRLQVTDFTTTLLSLAIEHAA